MSIHTSSRLSRIVLLSILVGLVISFMSTSVYSKPPPWAPAHGYRNKHKHKHKHSRGHEHYDRRQADVIGILKGRCNYEKVGTIVGAAAGAVIGSKVVDKDEQVVGVIAGTVIGLIIGKTIGREMDQRDRHCAGQALEFAETGQTIGWQNPNTNIDYELTPINSYQSGGLDCRLFSTKATLAYGHVSTYKSDACLHEDGIWRTLY